MKGMRRVCIAFDLDDTLFKERAYVLTGWRAVADTFSPVAGMSSDDMYFLMTTASDAFDALLEIPAIRQAGIGIQDFLSVYRAHKPELTLPSETVVCLNRLKKAGIDLAIITDGRSVTQRNKIEALGLDMIFPADSIFISEEVGADKLTPEPFKRLMHLRSADCYYMIGDNPTKDFYHPNLLGWTTIMLRDRAGINVPSQSLDELEPAYWPQIFIDNLTQLPELCLPL